jgi:DUF1365 family protein
VTAPALYRATVQHTRRTPVDHRFRYRTCYWLIDLDRPPRLPRPLRWLGRVDARDHIDVREVLADHGLSAARIVVLTGPRTLGYVFNPISVYWCYDTDNALVAQVAEVHNTYGGRHAYVLRPDPKGRSRADKAMYVSPFHAVDGTYLLRISEPAQTVAVSVTLHRAASSPFVATLHGRREPFTLANVARAWVRFPWASLRVAALIRWQGIRLWRRGLEVQPR